MHYYFLVRARSILIFILPQNIDCNDMMDRIREDQQVSLLLKLGLQNNLVQLRCMHCRYTKVGIGVCILW